MTCRKASAAPSTRLARLDVYEPRNALAYDPGWRGRERSGQKAELCVRGLRVRAEHVHVTTVGPTAMPSPSVAKRAAAHAPRSGKASSRTVCRLEARRTGSPRPHLVEKTLEFVETPPDPDVPANPNPGRACPSIVCTSRSDQRTLGVLKCLWISTLSMHFLSRSVQ